MNKGVYLQQLGLVRWLGLTRTLLQPLLLVLLLVPALVLYLEQLGLMQQLGLGEGSRDGATGGEGGEGGGAAGGG